MREAKLTAGTPDTPTASRPAWSGLDLFTADQTWLAGQPRMAPWPDGCSLLLGQLEQWLATYTTKLCGEQVTSRHPAYPAYVERLWKCWSYHWAAAVEAAADSRIDGREVAENIRAGRGLVGKGALDGDVLRDVTLAEAVLRRENAATEVFVREYQDYAIRLAGKMRAALADDLDWWSELLDRLAGYTRPPGKLARFAGKAGLRPWLGTVVRLFLIDRAKRDRLQTGGDDSDDLLQGQAGDCSPERAAMSQECMQLFQNQLRRALEEMPAEDRLSLLFSYVDGLKGKDAAAALGINPGTFSRRRDKALERFRELLSVQDAGGGRAAQTYRDCLTSLLAGPGRMDFARAVYEGLREAAPEPAHS